MHSCNCTNEGRCAGCGDDKRWPFYPRTDPWEVSPAPPYTRYLRRCKECGTMYEYQHLCTGGVLTVEDIRGIMDNMSNTTTTSHNEEAPIEKDTKQDGI